MVLTKLPKISPYFLCRINKQMVWYIHGLLTISLGIFIPIILPYIHFGILYRSWNVNKPRVDKDSCACNCWDTIFKGSYQEYGQSYKHFYFNVTQESFLIWCVTVAFVVALYECSKRIVDLVTTKRIRLSMLVLTVASIYPHYYTWWSYVNAWNDEFYEQFFHQAVFSITEIISTVLIVRLIDNSIPIQPRHMLVITSIAAFHILASGSDQFVINIFQRRGEWHQQTRDLAFMSTDVLNFLVPLAELRTFIRMHKSSLSDCFSFDELALSVIFVFLLWVLTMMM